ncbi:MAG: hypothetical protein JRI68_05015 [Deltaproteobacteria bacterium]|nr:hypothetical protein [Deltaproteobacteria bacterium]
MSTSWTEYRGQGFWCRDGMVEVWLALLVDELDERGGEAGGELPRWLLRLREQWIEQVSVIYRGLVSSSLDDWVSNEGRRQELVGLIRPLRERLASGAVTPAPGSVARAVGGAVFERDRATEQILRVADSFLWLLDGSLGDTRDGSWRSLLSGASPPNPALVPHEVGG